MRKGYKNFSCSILLACYQARHFAWQALALYCVSRFLSCAAPRAVKECHERYDSGQPPRWVNDVLADMVSNAALECYGVVGMAAPNAADGIAKILPRPACAAAWWSPLRRSAYCVELYVVIEYGTNINTVSQNLVVAK